MTMRSTATFNLWTVRVETTKRFQSYVLGPFLILCLGEADTEEDANALREIRLNCGLARRFISFLGNTLEARVLAARVLDLAQAPSDRTVTAAEVATLANRLRDPAKEMRALIKEADYPVLWALLPGLSKVFVQALETLGAAEAAAPRGRPWPGSRQDLYLSYLVRAWNEVYGEHPAATTGFIQAVEAVHAEYGIDSAAELEEWTERALRRLQTSSPV